MMPRVSFHHLALAFLIVAGCEQAAPIEWTDEGTHRWRPLRVSGGTEAGFTEVGTRRTGVEFLNTLDPETALENEHLLVGSGVAIGDVDGDDRPDIYLARLEGPNALYLNRGGWRFDDATEGSGTALDDRFSTGVTMADVDGDADLDLVVTSLGGPDAVLLNDGTGRFEERADAGLEAGLGSTTSALADIDADGDLDLYVTAYKARSASDELRMLERPMTDITGGTTDSLVVAPEFREHYRVEIRDGREVVAEQADADRLYLNDGTGRFSPVSWTGGAFLDERGLPLERDLDDFGLAARFHDVNGDGTADLYVCNDFDDPDQLWLGDGAGSFRAATATDIRTTPHASMSVDFADLDRDGSVEIFVAEMRASDHRRWLRHVPFQNRLFKPVGRIDDRPQVQRNALYTRVPGAGWSEIAEMAGVDASDWTWASLFLDVDLDGYEDLLVANGYSRDTQNGDVVDEITSLQGQASNRELKRLYPPQRTRNVAFRNRGDLTFEDAGEAWGFGDEEDISHGMAAGDLDGDGDLDLAISRLGDPALLLRNDAGASRVAVRLRPGGRPEDAGGRAGERAGEEEHRSGGNTRGVGATVRLVAPGFPTQTREVTAGGLYLSSSDDLTTFAAPDGATDLRLEVDWPDGTHTVVEGVASNRMYEILEGRTGGRPVGDVEAVGDVDAIGNVEAGADLADETLFRDVTARLGHVHPEAEFEDFLFQPLLPIQLSRLGPGVTWVDLDGDGDPDLVVPPGAGGRLSWLRNDEGTFTAVPLDDRPPSLDRTAAVPLPGRDGPTLFVGQSSYEAVDPNAAWSTPMAVEVAADGGVRDLSVTSGPGSAGPVAAADVDGDGALEVFVGGRVVKGLYPVSPPSALLQRDGSGWIRDAAADSVLAQVGMVSGATFSDIDADGDPDLLLATEWGPVRLLRNDDGRLVEATAAWGLDGLLGRWNGIATGDFDADGRPDVVVTGWGRNVRYQPTPDRPITLYHGDLDGNGSWEVVPAQDMTGDGVLETLVGYDRLRRAIPSLRGRVPDFRSYSDVPLREILGTDETYARRAVTLEHTLLLNRGDDFEVIALPDVTQRAPGFGVTVADFDGDGREDLFVAQNFFPTHLFQPRYDAGYGVVLLGRGDGTFEPLDPAASGVVVYGDQRGAAVADYDGDGRTDLAVGQNGAATRLFRNESAAPGVRVRLQGPTGNPLGVGATVHLEYADGSRGPAREVQAGGGYWSVDDALQVLGVRSRPAQVVVRWPDGGESREDAPGPGGLVTIARPGG